MSQPFALNRLARIAALLIAFTALSSIILRIGLSVAEGQSAGEAIWGLLRFFTILTNLLVGIVFGLVGFGRAIPPRVLMALTSAIAGVGLVYHALLVHLNPQEGWGLIADHGVHTAVPLLCVAWFLAFIPVLVVRWRDAIFAAAWPTIYCIYALARGAMDGLYPYPFIDGNTLAASQMMMNIIVLTLFFMILGAALIGGLKLRARLTGR